jgi:hypothetical protein
MNAADLRKRYTPDPVPPCPVCGGPLTPQNVVAGCRPEWACAALYGKMTILRRSSPDWQHYEDSTWRPAILGDPDVISVLDTISPERFAAALVVSERRCRNCHELVAAPGTHAVPSGPFAEYTCEERPWDEMDRAKALLEELGWSQG